MSVTGDTNPFNSRGVLVDHTTTDMATMERQVREGLLSLAVENISDINSRGDAVVRDVLPDQDLDSGTDNNWNGDDNEWTQDGLATDQFNETYALDSDGRLDGKIIAFYAVSNLDSTPSTTELQFLTNTGGTFERLQVEGLLVDEETTGMLADPVIFGATQDGAIEQYVTQTDDQVVLHGAVVEPEGSTLEESGRFASDRLPQFGGGE